MKKGSCLLLVLLLLLMLPVKADAVMGPDLSREVSLELSFLWEEQPLSGAAVSLYQVCSMDSHGNLTPLETISDFDWLPDIREEKEPLRQETAEALERYLLSHPEIPPTDMAVTQERGTAAFPSGSRELSHGLYLVRSIHHSQDHKVYSTSPFFVQLPGREGLLWDYSVEARAKPEQSEEQISLRVIKIWEDKYWENRRPAQIRVHLYCDEALYDTVTLPRNGKWAYQWAGLDAAHSWTVKEEPLTDYTTKLERSGNTFYITNTYAASASQTPGLPQTGQLWWPVPVLLAAGLLLLVLGKVRKKRYEAS